MTNLHFAQQVTMVGSEGWIVKAPVEQIILGTVLVPLVGRQIDGYLHPVSLSLIIAKHWRRVVACFEIANTCDMSVVMRDKSGVHD